MTSNHVMLFDSSGGTHVADVRILPFVALPEVVLWGTRIFLQEQAPEAGAVICYREARGVTTALGRSVESEDRGQPDAMPATARSAGAR
jgi:hypothetical protein